MLNLEVRHLSLMKAIAEEGTITRSSDRLNLTQSALSHQLRDAEQKLGVQLFLRLKKRMILTPAGERLLRSANKLLADLQATEDEVRQIGAGDAGVLRVSTECYTCYHWLPPMLKIFHRKFPNVSVQIVVEATRDPLTALNEGKIDLAIVSSDVADEKLSVEPIFDDELVAVVSPDHRLAARSFLRADDFTEEHLLTYSVPASDNAIFHKFLVPAGVEPKKVSKVDLTEAIVELVKADLGIAILARWAVKPQLEKKDLIGLKLGKKGLIRTWSAVTRKGGLQPRAKREFIDLLSGKLRHEKK